MADDAPLAILPGSMGKQAAQQRPNRPDPHKFIPAQKGGLILPNQQEEECPYTFSDSPAYVARKKAEDQAKRAVELEGKAETRGFLQNIEELAKKHKWSDVHQVIERRTAVPSGLFLITRAVLRWKFCKYHNALRDAEEALRSYGSSSKAGPLGAAFASFVRICLGSEPGDRAACGKEMAELVAAWDEAEQKALAGHALGQGLFRPRRADRLEEPSEVVEGMTAQDGTYMAASGVRVGYVFLKNHKDAAAPVLLHFHGSSETAADYRSPALASKYRDIPVHLLVCDYRGYGWSSGEPSLATFLRDAEPLAEKLPEIFIQHGLAWPYPGGLILSGRSLGAQVAVHLAVLFPSLFRALMLDSAMASSATGNRLGRAPERAAAVACWKRELEKANLEILQPLADDLWRLSVLDKITPYEGQLLVMHGLEDELVPYDGSESLHLTATTRRKELVLVEGAGHNDIGQFDAYWSAMRRFSLKVQLDDVLPSVGPAVEHFCAVCAAKAVSKCGRCQKVWYCGRPHQAEHWKSHKATCAGGAPEPKPKVAPEGEACLVVLLPAEIASQDDVASLSACVASVAAQEEPAQSLHVGWHAASDDLAGDTREALEALQAAHPTLRMAAVEAGEALPLFSQVRRLMDSASGEVPPHAWVVLLSLRELWSPRHVALLLPALRRAAPDQRVLALRCSCHAVPKEALRTAAEVDAALSSGAAELRRKRSGPHLGGLAVRLRILQTFVDATPAQALAHHLCAFRLDYRLEHTFGKKVQPFEPPDGEWMLCSPLSGASSTAPAEWRTPECDADTVRDSDRDKGRVLFDGYKQAMATATPVAEPAAPQFASEEDAARAIVVLRQDIERKLIVASGETMDNKDFRTMTRDLMNGFLQELGLGEVIGIQRWARDTATDLGEAAAKEFAVEIVTAPK